MDNITREENIKILYKLYPILKSINDDNNEVISRRVIFKSMESDECISSAKGVCEGILFVLNGNINIKRISLDGNETNLYDLKDGEICHEALSCLLEYKSLNIIGTAVVKSKVCIIPVEIVKKYILTSNEFLRYIYKDIYEKFHIVIKNKEDKNNKSIEERILEFIKNKNSETIYITHKELAMKIDSSREVVSRKLKELESRGLISLNRGKIIVINNSIS